MNQELKVGKSKVHRRNYAKVAKRLDGMCDLAGISVHTHISTTSLRSYLSPEVATGAVFKIFKTEKVHTFRSKNGVIREEELYCPNLYINTHNGLWSVDPIVGYARNYELILGLDWLKENNVLLDVLHHRLKFRIPGVEFREAAFMKEANGTMVLRPIDTLLDVNTKDLRDVEESDTSEEFEPSDGIGSALEVEPTEITGPITTSEAERAKELTRLDRLHGN